MCEKKSHLDITFVFKSSNSKLEQKVSSDKYGHSLFAEADIKPFSLFLIT